MVRCEMLLIWFLPLVCEVTSHYTSQWAAHIEGGPTNARRIAEMHGFTLLAEVSHLHFKHCDNVKRGLTVAFKHGCNKSPFRSYPKIFPDMYHLEHKRIAKRSIHPSTEHHNRLILEKDVKWAKQQHAKRRRKRDFMTRKELGYAPSSHVYANDPKWPLMWYLNRGQGLDMSVEGAWRQGITGKGIVVTILDDGLEKDHPDLKDNYDPQASFDVNNHDDDPMPRYDSLDSNRHGTRCAGEVAAVANNSICSLGIAYKASVGGVRMLDGDVTDAVEARSLSLNPQHIDIYSASWGPDDDGKTVDGPGELAVRAFVEGVTKGRNGRGSIFIWASGNGGRDHDNCNCDGYTNSIWTLSISSATENGHVPWYSEACSSTLATTYSSGSNVEKQIVTTDLHKQCTTSHTGTSASAPLAAGICALALEANKQLTWRDMQHIVVATAKPANLQAPDWTTNGVGRNVSHSFGYGLMDANAMVTLAKRWTTVPQQHRCEVSAPHLDKAIPGKGALRLNLEVKECNGVNYLEHVQAKITLMSQRRGDIQITLISPAGTKTILLAKRLHDLSRSGFRSWPFMSVHTWGENPIGTWTLEIHNEARFFGRATLQEWALIFYGTQIPPPEYSGVYVHPNPPIKPSSVSVNTSSQPKKTKGSRKNKTNPTPKSGKGKGKKNEGVAPSPRKTPRPSVISARRPTVPPPTVTQISTHPVGLTILLAPPQQPSQTTNNFPAIFQQYNKVQQLFPYSKINESPLRPSRKGHEQSDLQKEAAHLSDWNLIFYGTETAPGAESDVNAGLKSDESPSIAFGQDNSVDIATNANKGKELTQRTGFTSHEIHALPDGGIGLSSACQKATSSCLECSSGWFLNEGKCKKECPVRKYEHERFCEDCHYSCKTCSGPNDYECTGCYADASLYSSDMESFCYPKSLLLSINYNKWYYRTYVALVVNAFLLIAIAVVYYFKEKGCRLSKTMVKTPMYESVRYRLTPDDDEA